MQATTQGNLTPEHVEHLLKELGEGGPELAMAHGVRSVTEAEALELGFFLTGADGAKQSSSGILFPGQLRCDDPPIGRDSEPARYLSRAGAKHEMAIVGTGEPTFATEGWKDAARLHLATGRAVAAIPGVHSWPLLPPSVRTLIYDADAALNPHVWGPLIRAGAERPRLRLAFFDPAIAGPKGGACEFFGNGGILAKLPMWPPRKLLNHVVELADRSLRPDWHGPTVRAVACCAAYLEVDRTTRDALIKRISQRLSMGVNEARSIAASVLERMAREQAEAEGRDYDAERAAAQDKEEPTDTRTRCQRLVAAIGHLWRADHGQRDGWRRWTGRHWEDVAGNDALLAEIEAFLEARGWQDRELATIRSLVAAFRRSVRAVASAPVAGLLPFRNGCLRLEDGALLPHRPPHGNTWHLPYDYDPAAACDRIKAFLEDRLEDPASVALFRAFAWHLLMGRRPKEFLEVTGASNTGKSVIANLLVALVGRQSTEAGTLERLEDRSNRFETIRFRGRRLAVFSEAHRYSGPLETLKSMTGGDPISAERKGSHADAGYTFHGGVVLVGNGPIRPSDSSGAVIIRRRSLHVDKVIAAADERPMLDPDDGGGWRGELAGELPGLAVWVLAMTEAEARAALARDVASMARVEAEITTLLETDHLAAWADECLVWDPKAEKPARVGMLNADPDTFLLANYRRWLAAREDYGKGHGHRTFSTKLIGLLRDTLSLAMPPGRPGTGDYHARGVGTVIPRIRLRWAQDGEGPGVIRSAFMSRMEATAERMEATAERIGNGKNPVGNGWNGRNGSLGLQPHTAGDELQQPTPESLAVVIPPHAQGEGDFSVPSVPSVPHKGFHRSRTVPESPRSVPPAPQPVGVPVWVDGEPGWRNPGGWPKGNGPTVRVLLIDPSGVSRQVERRRISTDAPEVTSELPLAA